VARPLRRYRQKRRAMKLESLRLSAYQNGIAAREAKVTGRHRRKRIRSESVVRLCQRAVAKAHGRSRVRYLLSCFLAASTTLSRVKPNFFCTSLSGADAPKVFIPMRPTSLLTKRAQPKVEACSTETRAVTSRGSTLSL